MDKNFLKNLQARVDLHNMYKSFLGANTRKFNCQKMCKMAAKDKVVKSKCRSEVQDFQGNFFKTNRLPTFTKDIRRP